MAPLVPFEFLAGGFHLNPRLTLGRSALREFFSGAAAGLQHGVERSVIRLLQLPARSILNKIVTAELGSSVPGPQRVWIATFPASPVLSRTGYFETVPVWDPDAVPVQEQSFWVLLPWGHPPPEKMVK
jgi:hypothetical protein